MPVYWEGDPTTWVRTSEEEVLFLSEAFKLPVSEARKVSDGVRLALTKACRDQILGVATAARALLGLDEPSRGLFYISESEAIERFGFSDGRDFWLRPSLPPPARW